MMTFDRELLETYRTLLRTTRLQQAYQEFVRMFRCLRAGLEQRMPEYRFQGAVSENAMDYSYFTFTGPGLKENGLKLTVAFVHAQFRLEVWLSGANRAAQCRWAQRLSACEPPAQLSADPSRTDYILRMPVETDLADADAAAGAVADAAQELVRLALCGGARETEE